MVSWTERELSLTRKPSCGALDDILRDCEVEGSLKLMFDFRSGNKNHKEGEQNGHFLDVSSPGQHLAHLGHGMPSYTTYDASLQSCSSCCLQSFYLEISTMVYLLWNSVFHKSRLVEFISTMAVGWNSQLIVETWSQGGLIATTVGLAVVRSHTCRRHVCIVSDE
ncbi:hypothetical protein JHK85_051121 [Glycine max]|nr:hypothetical protein JHK85_051121 [Glycine max]